MTLKQQAITGVKWTTLSSLINTGIQLVQLAIITRILKATDFGLMALVVVVIGFSQMFIDMGISNAIIYKQKVTENQLNSLYWLNIFAGIIIFVIVFFLSPHIAKFYQEPELKNLIILVGITFLIQPFGQQFMILLQKNLEFDKIAKSQIIAKFLSFIVTISFAFLGYGVYSLAFGNITYTIILTIIFIILGLRIHKPKLHFKKTDLKDYISFGLFQMGEKIINYFNSQFDTILIGKLLGTETLGIYNIAKRLVMKPSQVINPIITRVTFPVMSKVNDNIPKLKNIYLKTIKYLSSVNFPIYILIAIFAQPIVYIMFGSKWSDTIPLIQIMSLAYLLRSTVNPIGSLQLARGRADMGFYWNVALFCIVPLFIFLGSFWGVNGVALATLFLQILLFYPVWKIMVNKLCNAKFLEYSINIVKPLIVCLLSGILVNIPYFLISKIYLNLIIGTIIFTTIYIFLTYKFNNEFFNEMKKFILGFLVIKN